MNCVDFLIGHCREFIRLNFFALALATPATNTTLLTVSLETYSLYPYAICQNQIHALCNQVL